MLDNSRLQTAMETFLCQQPCPLAQERRSEYAPGDVTRRSCHGPFASTSTRKRVKLRTTGPLTTGTGPGWKAQDTMGPVSFLERVSSYMRALTRLQRIFGRLLVFWPFLFSQPLVWIRVSPLYTTVM